MPMRMASSAQLTYSDGRALLASDSLSWSTRSASDRCSPMLRLRPLRGLQTHWPFCMLNLRWLSPWQPASSPSRSLLLRQQQLKMGSMACVTVIQAVLQYINLTAPPGPPPPRPYGKCAYDLQARHGTSCAVLGVPPRRRVQVVDGHGFGPGQHRTPSQCSRGGATCMTLTPRSGH